MLSPWHIRGKVEKSNDVLNGLRNCNNINGTEDVSYSSVSNGADIICVSCSFHKRIEMRFQTKLAWTNMQIMQSRYDSRRSSIPLVKNLSDVFRQTKPYCAAAADTWESVGKLTIFKLQKNASAILQQQRYVNSIFRSSIFGIGRSNYDNDMRGNFSKQTVDHCVYYSRIAWGQSH